LNQTIKVLFASGSEDLIPTAIEQMQKLFPELPLVVVSEFPVSGARWIPYPGRPWPAGKLGSLPVAFS